MQKQRWVVVAAALASFLVSLDALVVTTALPTIRRDRGASLNELGAGVASSAPILNERPIARSLRG